MKLQIRKIIKENQNNKIDKNKIYKNMKTIGACRNEIKYVKKVLATGFLQNHRFNE